MTMPTLVQNLMNRQLCANEAVWKATVRQLDYAVRQFGESNTPWDEAFVKEVLVYAEAYARLEIQGNEIFPEHEGQLTVFEEWRNFEGLMIDLEALAFTADTLYWNKLALILQEKGIEEQDTEEFSVIENFSGAEGDVP